MTTKPETPALVAALAATLVKAQAESDQLGQQINRYAAEIDYLRKVLRDLDAMAAVGFDEASATRDACRFDRMRGLIGQALDPQ